ncbi:histone-lysine N-methyltransferase SETMAR [Trichonephila clavipes]|uniref:Histone-lysine N-methyltransferase SETMAR n=1 Tax=Trichonephila clavipes TaxID=2585209 RepID=A0A8X7B9N7_TRICX|nr:histone-lysine N-methyltransferase SETMAR [Trichonephila clavipes]
MTGQCVDPFGTCRHQADDGLTLLELERAGGIQKRTTHRILRNELHLHKIAARFVPHALIKVQRWLCYAICSDPVSRWQQNGHQLLSRIIAIDEFWARAYEPELKHQSTEWWHAGSPRKQKVRQNPSPIKLMVIVVNDVRSVIVCHFVPHGRTVTE